MSATPVLAQRSSIALSIVIPAYNERDYLPHALSYALMELERCDLGDAVELIVVDNASEDDTATVAAAFNGVRVVSEPDKGLTRARQRGLDASRGDIIAYIDADTRMPEGWIERLLDGFSEGEHVVCVSGPYDYYDAPHAHRLLVRAYWRALALPAYRLIGYMAVGGNFAARRWALEKIGGFDTSIAFYGEDTNIARRLASVGKVRFVPNLVMPTSARRLAGQGMVKTALIYVANFLSEVILRRPLNADYRDIR